MLFHIPVFIPEPVEIEYEHQWIRDSEQALSDLTKAHKNFVKTVRPIEFGIGTPTIDLGDLRSRSLLKKGLKQDTY